MADKDNYYYDLSLLTWNARSSQYLTKDVTDPLPTAGVQILHVNEGTYGFAILGWLRSEKVNNYWIKDTFLRVLKESI